MENKIQVSLSFQTKGIIHHREEDKEVWEFLIKEMQECMGDNSEDEDDFLTKYFTDWEGFLDWDNNKKPYGIEQFVTRWLDMSIHEHKVLYNCLVGMYNKYKEQKGINEKIYFEGIQLIEIGEKVDNVKVERWGDTSHITSRVIRGIFL